MKKPDFVINTEKIYKSFSSEIEKLRNVGELQSHFPKIDEITIAAYVKCYDFMLYVCNLDKAENAFFQIPFLRGLCEDLISISYLLHLEEKERNSIILCRLIREFENALEVQEDYFKKHNPIQPILPKTTVPDLQKYIEHYKKEGIKITERYLPSVQSMSSKVGLKDLYNYLYAATSKTVHFDIRRLTSMGWGEIDKKKGTINPTFSYKNNYHHYYKFTFFYTSIIFINQTSKFSGIIDKSGLINSKLDKLIEGYKLIDWPEIVTFEQMNIPRPESNQNILYRTMANMHREGKIEFKEKNDR